MLSMVTDLGSLLHTLPSELKNEVRKLEKVSLKLVKSECRELFNSVCVRENLLPNYSNIRLHDEATKREPIMLKFCTILGLGAWFDQRMFVTISRNRFI